MKIFTISCLLLAATVQAQYTDYNIQKEVRTQNKGAVVSAHPLASDVGAKILREGGNAFDAAIAVQFALAVVYPQAGNIGGGGFLVAYTENGKKISLDYRETAPKNASRDMYLDKNGKADTNLSQFGELASGVPGSVAGFYSTLKYAKFPMEKLIQPAIDLAEKGFAITEKEAELMNNMQINFKKFNNFDLPFVKNSPWKSGDILVQKDLAQTLKKIQKGGLAEFYQGETARKIAETYKVKGLIILDDLKNYKVKERQPIDFQYHDYEVLSMPLPSSGGILLEQMLKMSSMANLGKYQQNSTQAVQIMVEAERRAFADRAEYMGDPDFIDNKTEMLVSDEYLQNRWKSYKPNTATKSSDVGKIISVPKESTQTTHISVLDKFGNAVSITTTLNGLYGSKVMVKGAGFFMNNEMDDFSVKPGVPNMFGAVGGEANKIAPGKRMLSSMTPTIVLKNNKPYLVVGTPGGTTIPTSVYQSIVNIVDFKMSPNIAVNAPKFHHQWLPENVMIEKGFNQSTRAELEKMNYKFEETDGIGRVELILSDQGKVVGVADGRGDDSVAVE